MDTALHYIELVGSEETTAIHMPVTEKELELLLRLREALNENVPEYGPYLRIDGEIG